LKISQRFDSLARGAAISILILIDAPLKGVGNYKLSVRMHHVSGVRCNTTGRSVMKTVPPGLGIASVASVPERVAALAELAPSIP
jgi:hypothetical protein